MKNVKCISHEQILVEQIVILYLVGWVEILYFIEIIMDKHYLSFYSLVKEVGLTKKQLSIDENGEDVTYNDEPLNYLED